ncbi:MAG: ester cyclase [Pseudomonadota bacterium]
MASISESAFAFFDACETGKGWDVCSQYCTPDASFSSQAEPLLEVTKLSDYAEWMKGLFGPIPNASYELKSFGLDQERASVCAYAVFNGTHTGEGGPVPATGKSTSSDYVYVMEFDGDKIRHMTKIWHAGLALQDLGWV